MLGIGLNIKDIYHLGCVAQWIEFQIPILAAGGSSPSTLDITAYLYK